MGILTRLRTSIQNRVQSRLSTGAKKSGPGKVGEQFTVELEKEWEEIPEQIDAYTRKVGSSIVGSWEVAAAEIGRTVIGLPNEATLIERFSDALVPTLSPYQDLHKKAPTVCKEALKAAKSSQEVASLVPALQKLTAGLGPEALVGWGKTLEYLGPILELSQDKGLKDRMLGAGVKLELIASQADQLLAERLLLLPESPALFQGVCDAFEAWQLLLCRELEIALDVPTQELVRALKKR